MTALTVTQANLPAKQTLKSTTKEAVQTAVVILLSTDETTTTLDVKNLLRQEGYHATQRLVSKLMHEIADEGFLSTVDTGNYLLWSQVQVSTPVIAPIQIN